MKFKEEDRAALRRYYSLNFKRTLFRKQDAVVINGLLDDIDELLKLAEEQPDKYIKALCDINSILWGCLDRSTPKWMNPIAVFDAATKAFDIARETLGWPTDD